MTNDQLAWQRRRRAADMDRLLRQLFVDAVPAGLEDRIALVAVGGYGRAEMSPYSDLDVVLVHHRGVRPDDVREAAEKLWYPIWDRGLVLDHSVRDVAQMRDTAAQDYRAAFGMLDFRTIAGDDSMVSGLRSHVLNDWRKTARQKMAQVRLDQSDRVERFGWLAHSAIPNLKESAGGLRDGVIMRALEATWLVEVPRAESEGLRADLLDVRDSLHAATGKRSDRLTPEVIADVAQLMGMQPEELDLHTRGIGRRLFHLSSLVWRRYDDSLASTPARFRRVTGPKLDELSPGVAMSGNEVVLTASADCAADPELPLRAAEAAARREVPLSTASARRIAATMVPLAEPWSITSRRLMVNLLAAGPGLVTVWDELDFVGVIDTWLREWAAIRLRGSSSPVHRYTVDRHSLETCVQVATRLRDVKRPDLLLVAALLHDIGKGRAGDHSEVGGPMAESIARRWGFNRKDAVTIGRLVRWHLLLPTTATRRDIEDPVTVANVAERVGDLETLELLAALTEADARSTSSGAWSTWRAGLIRRLVTKISDYLDTAVENPDPESYDGWPAAAPDLDDLEIGPSGFALSVSAHRGGSLVTVAVPDRLGAMADVAGGIAMAGLEIQSARATIRHQVALSLWEVTRDDIDPRKLSDRLRIVLEGSAQLPRRLEMTPCDGEIDTRVHILKERSSTASVIEIRTGDRRGLVWSVCRAIADAGCQIRSAHLSTYGPEARDVFYVVNGCGGAVVPEALERLVRDLRSALTVSKLP